MSLLRRLSCALALAGVAADDFESFRAWLKEHGAQIGPVDIGVDEKTGLRGLVAQEKVPKGATLFKIPKNLVLTVSKAREEGVIWQQCSASGQGFLGSIHTSMALFLLEQREAGKHWQPFVNTLPEDFLGFPYFYTEKDMKGLQASPLKRVFEMENRAIKSDLKEAQTFWPDLKLSEFKWARTAVKSRVFSLASLSDGVLKKGEVAPIDDIAMAPFCDFVNHPVDGVVEANANPKYDVSDGSLYFEATTDIPVGAGIYWDYGFRSNRHSATRYGFVNVKRVPLTDLPLFFNIKKFVGSDAVLAEKERLLKEATESSLVAMEDDGSVLHELDLSLAGRHAEKLLGHMRFMAYTGEDPSKLAAHCPDTYCTSIDLATEKDALQTLVDLVESLHDSYGTTAEVDEELIEDMSMEDGAQYQVKVLRFGEKKILRGYMNIVGVILETFDLDLEAYVAEVQAKWNKPESDIHNYVLTNITALRLEDAQR